MRERRSERGEMTNSTIEELQSENQELRDLVASLSTTLLRHLALNPPRYRRNVSTTDAERLVEEAELCFRCARIPSVKKEVAEALQVGGNELMARAVEIETFLQREKWKK
jgi:hypothetical protein